MYVRRSGVLRLTDTRVGSLKSHYVNRSVRASHRQGTGDRTRHHAQVRPRRGAAPLSAPAVPGPDAGGGFGIGVALDGRSTTAPGVSSIPPASGTRQSATARHTGQDRDRGRVALSVGRPGRRRRQGTPRGSFCRLSSQRRIRPLTAASAKPLRSSSAGIGPGDRATAVRLRDGQRPSI